MCAIVDANVANAAVSEQANEASKEFLRHVSTGALKIVVGGYRLHDELHKCSRLFQQWFSRARYAGHIVDVGNELWTKGVGLWRSPGMRVGRSAPSSPCRTNRRQAGVHE